MAVYLTVKQSVSKVSEIVCVLEFIYGFVQSTDYMIQLHSGGNDAISIVIPKPTAEPTT